MVKQRPFSESKLALLSSPYHLFLIRCLSCRALEIALQLGPSALQPEPLLKISGIYVELANVLEIQRQRVSAFVELRTALEMFGPDPLRRPGVLPLPEATALGGGPGGQWIGEGYRLTEKDHVRAIGLCQKLGQLALEVASSPTGSTYASTLGEGSTGQMFKTWDDAAEHYLSSALTSMLHLACLVHRQPHPQKDRSSLGVTSPSPMPCRVIILRMSTKAARLTSGD